MLHVACYGLHKINMLPVLLNIGFLKLYTFGVFLVLSFFWGIFLLWKNIRLTSHKEEDVFDGIFVSLFSAIFFGRLVYVSLNFDKFGLDILKFILINGYPGISFFGLLFGGFLSLYLFFIPKKIKFKETVDYFISPLFLSIGFGKLGSFFSGAEVGTKTKFILSIKYFGIDSLRHLTPLYEAIIFFLASYIAYKILFEIRREKYPLKFNFYFFFWLVSLVYFSFDNLKAYKLYLLGWSFNQLVSSIILLTSTVYFIYYFRNHILNSIKIVRNSLYKYAKQVIRRDLKKAEK